MLFLLLVEAEGLLNKSELCIMTNAKKIELTIMISVKNEQGNVQKLVAEIDDVFGEFTHAWYAVRVDAGSTDGTIERVMEPKFPHRWIKLNKNHG